MTKLSGPAQSIVDWHALKPSVDFLALPDEERREVNRRLDAAAAGRLGRDELLAAEQRVRDARSDADKAGDWTPEERAEVDAAYAPHEQALRAMDAAARDLWNAQRDYELAHRPLDLVVNGHYETHPPDDTAIASATARRALAEAEYNAAREHATETTRHWVATSQRVGKIAEGRRLAGYQAENVANQQAVRAGRFDRLRAAVGAIR